MIAMAGLSGDWSDLRSEEEHLCMSLFAGAAQSLSDMAGVDFLWAMPARSDHHVESRGADAAT